MTTDVLYWGGNLLMEFAPCAKNAWGARAIVDKRDYKNPYLDFLGDRQSVVGEDADEFVNLMNATFNLGAIRAWFKDNVTIALYSDEGTVHTPYEDENMAVKIRFSDQYAYVVCYDKRGMDT